MHDHLSLLVISDLHAISDAKDENDSHLIFSNGESIYGNDFINYAKTLNQKIDVLICAGDIANSGSKLNFELGWNFLNKIKVDLGISELLCVPGNHDHQSRPTDNEYNPKETMQYAKPDFPFPCITKNTFFWAWNWCYTEGEASEYNALLINTSATHGINKEYLHGRISHQASDRIAEQISSPQFKKNPINILLCHHHPTKMEHVDLASDYEAIDGGDYLLRKLNECNKGPWLIIHGHKHFADVSYAASNTRNPPVVFSAGSFSARLYPKIQDRTSNQFYLIDIDLKKTEEEGSAVGTFSTHEFMIGRKWSQSNSSNLPAKGGFGSRSTARDIAQRIAGLITEDCPFIDKRELAAFDNEIKYFTPSEFKNLINLLDEYGLAVNNIHGSILEVGKPND